LSFGSSYAEASEDKVLSFGSFGFAQDRLLGVGSSYAEASGDKVLSFGFWVLSVGYSCAEASEDKVLEFVLDLGSWNLDF